MFRFFGWLLAIPPLCMADTLFVEPNANITEILQGANAGSWVILEDGVHQGPIVTYGRDFVIGSRYLLDEDTLHISETSIVPADTNADTASCVVYGYGETADTRLVGLTLSRGRGTFTDRLGDFAGGLVLIQSSSAQFEYCRFENGTAYFGGACAIASPHGSISSHVVFSSCSFDTCFAGGFGGGVYADQCSLTVIGCNMSRLEAGPGAGAINMTDGEIHMRTTRIEYCSGLVGGVMLSDCEGVVQECEFISNRCHPWGVCAHFDAYSFIGRVEGCVFRFATNGWPSIGIGGTSSETLFLGNVVRDNSALISSGTLVTYDRGQNEISHNLFFNNQNVYGGAVWAFQNSNANVHHNTFVANSSLNSAGGSAVQSVSLGRPVVNENIFEGNSGGAVSVHESYPVRIDARNNWWGDESGPFHPTLNPQGWGDTLLSDSVTFIPWLTSPPDTTLPSASRSRPIGPAVGTWDLQNVYPNPFNNSFTVSLSGFTGKLFELSLYNIAGQLVATLHSGETLGGLYRFTVSSGLSSGVYFVVAGDGQIRESAKVVLLK